MLFYEKEYGRSQVVQLVDQGFSTGRYKGTVFFFDDFGFCENNEIWHEHQAEAQALAQRFITDYESLGFAAARVAVASIEEQATFIEQKCCSNA